MRPNLILVLALSSLWLAGCTSPSGSDETGHNGKITAIKGQFPVLTRGMSADIVRQKLGEPAEIQPMEAPTGKAEVWVYYIEKTVGINQIASGMKDVPMFSASMKGGEPAMIPQPVYTWEVERSVVTLSLLMFNNHLAAQKAKAEKFHDYSNY